MTVTSYSRTGKRILDLVLVLLALPVVLPLMGLIALLLLRELGSPVLFRQERPGRHGRIFTLYKFRTMTDRRDEQGHLLPDAERITRIGQLLRKASLDELPELFNVLRGDMSLVGPRPLLIRYMPYYSTEERRRFDVRPGLTGWAQVHGRNNLPWNERLGLDVWYVENLSLRTDILILWKTLKQIVQGDDVQVIPNLAMLDLDEERQWTDLSRASS